MAMTLAGGELFVRLLCSGFRRERIPHRTWRRWWWCAVGDGNPEGIIKEAQRRKREKEEEGAEPRGFL